MIKSLLFISIAPVLIVALYVYIRDRYEKEPVMMLIKALISGILIVLPVALVEGILGNLGQGFQDLAGAAYDGFVVASFTEEIFKYIIFILFFWRSRNFNEKFDGIVYAVFISMGFALVENILYVYEGGYRVGVLRAITAVPMHALLGTVMGYHFGLARFYPSRRNVQLLLAFLMPFIYHGLYDFLLMAGHEIFLLIFIPLLVFFWVNGFMKMKELSMGSVFRNDFPAGGRDGESAGKKD